MVPYGACFHFLGLFCYKALTVKVKKKNVEKTLFKGSSYKVPTVKNNFWLIYTSSIVIQKQKNRVTRLLSNLLAFNCKVSFYRLILTTVIAILRLKFEVECYY